MNLGFEGMCLTMEFWNSQLSVGYPDLRDTFWGNLKILILSNSIQPFSWING